MPANVYIFLNIACPLGRLFVCACMCVHFKYPAGSGRQKKSEQHSVCTSLSYTPALDMHFLYINTQPCIYTKKYTTSGKHMHFVKLNIYARVYIKKRMCMQGYPGIKKYTAKHIQQKRRKKRMHKQAYARK